MHKLCISEKTECKEQASGCRLLKRRFDVTALQLQNLMSRTFDVAVRTFIEENIFSCGHMESKLREYIQTFTFPTLRDSGKNPNSHNITLLVGFKEFVLGVKLWLIIIGANLPMKFGPEIAPTWVITCLDEESGKSGNPYFDQLEKVTLLLNMENRSEFSCTTTIYNASLQSFFTSSFTMIIINHLSAITPINHSERHCSQYHLPWLTITILNNSQLTNNHH